MNTFLKNNPWRPIWIACILFIALGYGLYFIASMAPTPEWGRELIEYLAGSVKALDTAAQVAALKGNDPFPAQIVILYCAIGSILFAGWCLYAGAVDNRMLEELVLNYKAMPSKSRPSKFRLFVASSTAAGVTFLGWVILFLLNSKTISWRDAAFYSASVHSTTFLIACCVIFAISIPVAYTCLHLAFSKNSKTQG